LLVETIIKAVLLTVIILLAGMALRYLWKRELPPAGYVFWAVVALLIPVLGPILLIALRPGEARQAHQ
jgi:hypothetical protein